ncbi:MAG: histidine phosphotransferase ChpT [Caulobacterales bacterium]
MSDASPAAFSPPPISPQIAPGLAPEELAARLAARLCHDFISPASAIVSGLDLLDDPTAKDMRDDAMDLIAASARKLTAMLSFSRVAFGASAQAETFDSAELERLAQGIYAHVRPELAWTIEPQPVPKAEARTLLNLVQLAAGALPIGGIARVERRAPPGRTLLGVEARGPRARLHPEVLGGLMGEPLGEGLGGRWVQAYYLHALVKSAGGMLQAQAADDLVMLSASLPS